MTKMLITKDDIGMSVYDSSNGLTGKIINVDHSNWLDVSCEFVSGDVGCPKDFTTDGKTHPEATVQTIYWSKPKIIAPDKPKRVVEKTVWVNVYEGEQLYDTKKSGEVAARHSSYQTGDFTQCSLRQYLGCHPITIEVPADE